MHIFCLLQRLDTHIINLVRVSFNGVLKKKLKDKIFDLYFKLLVKYIMNKIDLVVIYRYKLILLQNFKIA